MITDDEIKQLAFDNGLTRGDSFHSDATVDFARAIYQLGRQHQRESDAALCHDAAEKYMERSKNANTHLRATAALASHAAVTCLENAIRNNTGELKWPTKNYWNWRR